MVVSKSLRVDPLNRQRIESLRGRPPLNPLLYIRDQNGDGATHEPARLKMQRQDRPGQETTLWNDRKRGGYEATFATMVATEQLRKRRELNLPFPDFQTEV